MSFVRGGRAAILLLLLFVALPVGAAELPGLDGVGDMGFWSAVVVIILATFVSEDLTCITAGLLVNEGRLDLTAALAGCFLGIFIGDFGLWLMGWGAGRGLERWSCLRKRLPEKRLERWRKWFGTYGWAAVIGPAVATWSGMNWVESINRTPLAASSSARGMTQSTLTGCWCRNWWGGFSPSMRCATSIRTRPARRTARPCSTCAT